MKDMTPTEIAVAYAVENALRKVLAEVKESKSIEEAVTKIEAEIKR